MSNANWQCDLPPFCPCGLSPHSESSWQTWSERVDLDISAVSHTWGRPLQADGYTSRQTTVSAAHQQPAARGVAAASSTAPTPSSPILLLLVTFDMADPSLTSPSGTPLRSPNASLTLSFPFLREGSRVWEEGKQQPLPRNLPSPLPTKRTRTYSA